MLEINKKFNKGTKQGKKNSHNNGTILQHWLEDVAKLIDADFRHLLPPTAG